MFRYHQAAQAGPKGSAIPPNFLGTRNTAGISRTRKRSEVQLAALAGGSINLFLRPLPAMVDRQFADDSACLARSQSCRLPIRHRSHFSLSVSLSPPGLGCIPLIPTWRPLCSFLSLAPFLRLNCGSVFSGQRIFGQ